MKETRVVHFLEQAVNHIDTSLWPRVCMFKCQRKLGIINRFDTPHRKDGSLEVCLKGASTGTKACILIRTKGINKKWKDDQKTRIHILLRQTNQHFHPER